MTLNNTLGNGTDDTSGVHTFSSEDDINRAVESTGLKHSVIGAPTLSNTNSPVSFPPCNFGSQKTGATSCSSPKTISNPAGSPLSVGPMTRESLAARLAKIDERIALAQLAGSERYLALEVAGARYNIGVKYGLLTAQLALALSGGERAEVLAQIVELLARTKQA